MRRHRHAKIVATLGPASSSPEMIRVLFEAGADVFRFNFSHGTHDEHQARYDIVRAIETETGRPIAVLADLQGPKLRIGHLASGPIQLAKGATLRLDLDPAPGTRERVPMPHPEVFAALKPGVQLLIDDGKMRFEVEEASENTLDAGPGNSDSPQTEREFTGQARDLFRQSSRFSLTGRDRLLKGVQLIDSLLLGCLQVMDRQSSRIWSGRSWTSRMGLLHRNGFVNAQDGN